MVLQSQTTIIQTNQISKNSFYSPKQKRAYGKLLTGMRIALKEGEKARFLTLSTSENQYKSKGYTSQSLNDDFRKLKQRIQRQTPHKLHKAGFITKSEMSYFYGHKDIYKPFKFNYFKVRTNEGYGVLHMIYKGSYLPYNYIVENWMDIHNSWQVNIQLVKPKRTDYKKATNYVITQYLSNQDTSYQRSSMSWNWTIRAYVREWDNFKRSMRQTYCYDRENKTYINRKGRPVNIYPLWMKHLLKIRNPKPQSIQQHFRKNQFTHDPNKWGLTDTHPMTYDINKIDTTQKVEILPGW